MNNNRFWNNTNNQHLIDYIENNDPKLFTTALYPKIKLITNAIFVDYGFANTLEESEKNGAIAHLHHKLSLFNPERGNGFTFISNVIKNYFLNKARIANRRQQPVDYIDDIGAIHMEFSEYVEILPEDLQKLKKYIVCRLAKANPKKDVYKMYCDVLTYIDRGVYEEVTVKEYLTDRNKYSESNIRKFLFIHLQRNNIKTLLYED